jgi:multimeric flavodoxin WrbA
MKITILNGSSVPSRFDAYLAQLKDVLETGRHYVTLITLRDLKLRYCNGCFGCWVRTPGECVSRDASLEIDRAVINSDFFLCAAPLKMGFPDSLLKMAMDKMIPLIHPYDDVADGEAHHKKRYARYPRLGLIVQKETVTAGSDLQIVSDIFCRFAINFKTRLEFTLTTDTPVEDIAGRINQHRANLLPVPGRLAPTLGTSITPPSRLAIFNGSPRGRKGSTPIMLKQLAQGFGSSFETYHLVQVKDTENMVQAFTQAECVILGFPLYTDAMPGIVKHFIEALEPLASQEKNPPLGFLVQSGFPEGLHSRYVERYLEKLAVRLGAPYLGTIVKGGGEGVRFRSAEATRDLFESLQTLGKDLARDGRFDPQVLAHIAAPESFPAALEPVFKLFTRLPVSHVGWDNMLKKNGVFERRNARPFMS